MNNKDKMVLVRKVGLFGLKDLRKLAPIGNLGTANGWYAPWGDGSFMKGGLERAIIEEFHKQGFEWDYVNHSQRGFHDYYNKELVLRYDMDSSG